MHLLTTLISLSLTTFAAGTPCPSASASKTSPGPIATPSAPPKICTKICGSEPIETCGRGWSTEKIGSCWACCRVVPEDDGLTKRGEFEVERRSSEEVYVRWE
ncbi:hypothetical protein IQ07DRAFT_592688 [Pyrenochaeta sp. DS3sAY3a]|nr:hypothetical protein IQ07DRAFT_592688 [Pyrenochaeta sp. DS3sAY3a]